MVVIIAYAILRESEPIDVQVGIVPKGVEGIGRQGIVWRVCAECPRHLSASGVYDVCPVSVCGYVKKFFTVGMQITNNRPHGGVFFCGLGCRVKLQQAAVVCADIKFVADAADIAQVAGDEFFRDFKRAQASVLQIQVYQTFIAAKPDPVLSVIRDVVDGISFGDDAMADFDGFGSLVLWVKYPKTVLAGYKNRFPYFFQTVDKTNFRAYVDTFLPICVRDIETAACAE